MKRAAAFCLVLIGLAIRPAFATDTVYYYHTDALRSEVVITDASHNVVERTYYGPYGEVLNRPLRDGPGYTGHEEDAATGLDNMQQRYYDPINGRFPSVDPVDVDTTTAANFNRYAYANDNPYRYTDPDGRQTAGDEKPEQKRKDNKRNNQCTGSHICGGATGALNVKITYYGSYRKGADTRSDGETSNSQLSTSSNSTSSNLSGQMLASNSDSDIRRQERILLYRTEAQEIQIAALHGKIPSDWIDTAVDIGKLSGGILLDNMAGGKSSFDMYVAQGYSPNPVFAEVRWPINFSNVDWARFASPDENFPAAMRDFVKYANSAQQR